MGYRFHQFADLGFQIFVGHDQGADRRPQITAAGRNCLIYRGFQRVALFEVRL